MSWEDQGRQYHMWFGHGTAPDKDKRAAPDPSVTGQSTDDRVVALAYGAIASLPASLRGRAEAQYQHGTLPRLKEAMTAWIKGTRLDQATFASRFFRREADDPIVRNIHSAALGAATATSHDDIRDAAGKVADAIKAVGVDQWPRFVADAAERARDPATQAAIERSRQPPAPARDAIRPVYPVETAIGVIGAGVVSGVGAAARAVGGAILKQVAPGSRPVAGGTPGGGTAVAEKPPNTPSPAQQSAPSPSGPVRMHEGQQGKHVEGTNNFIPGRSALTADPKELLKHFAGRGQQVGRIPVGQAGSKEAFDAGKTIGTFRTEAGRAAPTTRGMIHYSNKGAHIVLAAPRNWQP